MPSPYLEAKPKGGPITEVICYNAETELKKAAKGKKTKVDVGLLLYSALEGYPAIQTRIARAFGITEYRD